MKTSRKRPVRLSCEALEVRNLLSVATPTGAWVGQDGHDYVGRSSRPAPNGVQDIRIALAGLPIGRAVTAAEVRGHGGGIWTYNGGGTHWAAAFVREPGADRGSVFFESDRVEVGRPFTVRLWYDDGSTTLTSIAGGVADPTFRMPAFMAQPTWVGQDGSDRVGFGASVGPDGLQDAVVSLANLTSNVAIAGIEVRAVGGLAWRSGANPGGLPNAELVREAADPSRGRLHIQPDRDLAGLPLSLTITYADHTIDLVDLVAGPTDPALAVAPAPAPPIRGDAIASRWLGQADDPVAGRGAAGVALEGLPADRSVVGASLSGPDRGVTWAFKASPNAPVFVEPASRPLAFRRDPGDPTRASIAFPPEGNEQAATLSLRLQYDDGSSSIVRFPGGPSDSTLRAPSPTPGLVVARPGDDLHALVGSHGAVRLSTGVYELDRPLVLNRAVTISAEPGATLRFTQPADAARWPAAIVIHHGNTTLDGFAVRFGGPVRWDWSVPHEPAVIASTDQRDKTTGTVKVGLTLANLDLEGPPASTAGGPLERSAMLVNFVTAEDGRILGNRLRGGSVRVFGGPWQITGNHYLGAMPGTWVYDVFAMSFVHDVEVTDNVAAPLAGSGKTYRFLVMTQDGSNIRVERNRVEGLGPRDNDSQPHPNTPEVILTEAYHVNFEGAPRSLSANGTILRIPTPQGDPIRSGDLVAVLSGPMAGQWRRVAHVIDPTTLLLDRPLATDQPIGAVSVFRGFVGLTVADNRVDVRGGSEASPLVLAGANVDADVRGNHFLGGAAVRLESAASEKAVHWGWTHTPQLAVRFASNLVEDSQGGLDAGMVRYPHAKSSQGRTYFDGEIRDNLFAWSPAYFQRHGASAPPAAMLLGDPRTIDPLEVRMLVSGNLAKLPPGVPAGRGIDAVNMIYNGVAVASHSVALPTLPMAAPGGLRLVADTGISATDRLTADARLAFDRLGGAVGYEYRLAGQSTYRAVASPDGFLPEGAADGEVTVQVRAIDDYGRIGPESSFTFTLDTTPPAPVTPRLGPGQDTGISSTDGLTRLRSPILVADAGPGETLVLVLMPSGRELARSTGAGELRMTEALDDGVYQFAVRRIDAAGNSLLGASLTVTIDGTPPSPVAARLGPGQDTGYSSTDGLTRLTSPTFQAIIDNADTLILLRDGQEVDRTTGSGNLRSGGPLADGTYRFVVRRVDAAGNVADGEAQLVTIDATPPTMVGGLVHVGPGQFRFEPQAGAVDYTYRVGNGPVVPLAGATAFRVRGLPFEPTAVAVRAIDAAGNTGAEAVILAATPMPTGSWIGQRPGLDLVGPRADVAAPDGIQDVALAISGLPTDRSIASAEVRGWGGGIWQYNVAGGVHWKAALIHAPGTERAEIYIQPYQAEAGRSYFVRLNFSDGTTVGVTLDGGPVDPTLPAHPPIRASIAPAEAGPAIGAFLPAAVVPLPGRPGPRTIPRAVPGPRAEPSGLDPATRPAGVATPATGAGAIPAAPIGPADPGGDSASAARPATWRDRMAMLQAARLERMQARRRALEASSRVPSPGPAVRRPGRPVARPETIATRPARG